ncbi:hypothetical protein QA649_23175 [Bradyrhizobium sp. CB1717]|uniref:hypothetical protein n=1 Tax=Bradyrhizobium sp. CB1717 TaxID=3039154 RepID=UPI0024B16021|nr:hypothetical protein [Bradyrhizobium sp. CB1717]WFU21026.1 hypothetical protein QA649_23175 [Bradyrhizobium sp. CB1717]
MSGEDTSRRLVKHFVLYLDFLGMSQAVNSPSQDQLRQLIALLTKVAAQKTSFSIDGHSQPDGSYKFKVTPEVSTFSDNIVASYPIVEPGDEKTEAILVEMYVKVAQDFAIGVAIEALKIGMLTRGGLTIGQLYHSNGVVLGEAMVDAYNLESRVATYPRIAVSSRIYQIINRLTIRTDTVHRLAEDTDGIWYLRCYSEMVRRIKLAERKSWFQSVLKTADENIAHFEARESWNELAKWSWFKRRFIEEVKPQIEG